MFGGREESYLELHWFTLYLYLYLSLSLSLSPYLCGGRRNDSLGSQVSFQLVFLTQGSRGLHMEGGEKK